MSLCLLPCYHVVALSLPRCGSLFVMAYRCVFVLPYGMHGVYGMHGLLMHGLLMHANLSPPHLTSCALISSLTASHVSSAHASWASAREQVVRVQVVPLVPRAASSAFHASASSASRASCLVPRAQVQQCNDSATSATILVGYCNSATTATATVQLVQVSLA
jgi:hypothetical protein